jgi:hypothetical protein
MNEPFLARAASATDSGTVSGTIPITLQMKHISTISLMSRGKHFRPVLEAIPAAGEKAPNGGRLSDQREDFPLNVSPSSIERDSPVPDSFPPSRTRPYYPLEVWLPVRKSQEQAQDRRVP